MTIKYICGSSSVGRVSAFQADCREFESRLPLIKKTHLKVSLFNLKIDSEEKSTFEFGASEPSAES